MVGWHHQHDGHEFEQASRVGDGQEAWRAAVYGVAESQTRLSNCTELNTCGVHWAALVAQLVKNLSAMRESWVQSLGYEDPLEKGKATHSSILAWGMLWTIQSMGSQKVGHDCVVFIFTAVKMSVLISCSNISLMWDLEISNTP